MAKTAYQLKESYKELSGGSVALSDGTTFDVAKALEASKGSPEGYILVEDESVVTALDSYPALKRSSLPSTKEPEKPEPTKSPASPPKVGGSE